MAQDTTSVGGVVEGVQAGEAGGGIGACGTSGHGSETLLAG